MKTLVVGLGLAAAALIGAAPAQAAGFSVDVNGDGQSLDVGSGATTTQSGNASGNPALAVSLFGPASTSATGNATGNVLIAVDGQVSVAGNARNNTVVNVGGKTNTVAGNTSSVSSLTVCGTQFSGQGQVTINPLAGGVC